MLIEFPRTDGLSPVPSEKRILAHVRAEFTWAGGLSPVPPRESAALEGGTEAPRLYASFAVRGRVAQRDKIQGRNIIFNTGTHGFMLIEFS